MSKKRPSMYYGADVVIFENAKNLRNNMTTSEVRLWERLSKSQLGERFKPQHPISNFIVDFYCYKAGLVIELDGDIHFNEDNHEADQKREKEIEELGLKVLRFTNEQVFKDIESVLLAIQQTLRERLSQSPL